MNASMVNEAVQPRLRPEMGTKTLVSFLALTFGLSWVPMALFLLFADQLTPLFGEMSSSNPVFLLAVYAPGLSAIFLVWRHYGLKGLGSFFRRLTLWRAPLHWWLFLLARHSRHHLCRRCDQRHDQRPVPLLALDHGFPGAASNPSCWARWERSLAGADLPYPCCSVGLLRSGPA